MKIKKTVLLFFVMVSVPAYSMEEKSIVTTLSTIEDPEEFLNFVPQDMFPQEGESYEDNILMGVIPCVLKKRGEEYKNQVLASILSKRKDVSLQERYMIIALIKAGADPDFCYTCPQIGREESPVYQISYSQDKAFAQALLSRGANPNAQCHSMLPVLWTAHTVELADILVKHGASIRYKQPTRRTLLHHVAQHENFAAGLLRYFAGKGLDINDQDNQSHAAPLHDILDGFGYDHDRCVEKLHMLLDLGSDVTLKDNWGRTICDRLNYIIEKDEYPEAVHDKCQTLKNIILNHQAYSEEAARLRHIAL